MESSQINQRPEVPVTPEQMMVLLLAACPSFEPEYQEFLEEWEDNEFAVDEDGNYALPYYLALAELARHLVRVLQAGDTEEVQRVFNVAEHLLLFGDDSTSTAIGVGLLEDLQNGGNYEAEEISIEREDFRAFMGPEAEFFWNKLYLFWEHSLPDGVTLSPEQQARLDEWRASLPSHSP